MNSKEYRFIPSLDCTDLKTALRMVESVGDLDGVYGFKVGFSLGLGYGLPQTVQAIRKVSRKPVIYDHQKGGTDIPDTGALFAETMKNAGIDEAILFPQSGPETLRAWIAALQKLSIKTIVGAIMTHQSYLHSEGGFIVDSSARSIFSIARDAGIGAFVVPLTKPDKIRDMVQDDVFGSDPEFYSPGFGAQGGKPAAFDFIRRHLLIIGRSLFKAPNPREYLISTEKELQNRS